MIRTLRFKLIFASMLSLLIVLTVIVGLINALNYRAIVEGADNVLELLRAGGGQFPEAPEDPEWSDAGPRFQSPELSFEARYFSMRIGEDGEILDTDTGRIAAVDAEALSGYAQRFLDSEDESGFLDDYRYLRYAEGDAERILFLDCGRLLAGFREVLLNSVCLSLVGSLAVLTLIVLLSGRIVRPILRSYEKQRRFITDAGHEIRTPVTIIGADAELLELELGASEWIQDIRAQARRLGELTEDLICLSRMEEGGQAQMVDFPISDLVSETASSFQALARTQNKRFLLDVQPNLSFCGDEKRIAQLVTILLDNALKYGEAEGEICLNLRRQGKALILSVRNSARVSPETIENMFERFYRGDPARSSTSKGYGIGLSIARAIVQAHRGRIQAESIGGSALKISATLPLRASIDSAAKKR